MTIQDAHMSGNDMMLAADHQFIKTSKVCQVYGWYSKLMDRMERVEEELVWLGRKEKMYD